MVKPSQKQIVENAKQQRMAFFAQKREILFINSLTAILHREATDTSKVEDNVKLAVSYADEAFKALYITPGKEEQKAGE